MALNIPLDPDIVPPPLPEGADTKANKHKAQLELMSMALDTPRGLKIRKASDKDAMALRFRCYAARRYVQSQGIKSFDKLILTLEDECLIIRPDTVTLIETL